MKRYFKKLKIVFKSFQVSGSRLNDGNRAGIENSASL